MSQNRFGVKTRTEAKIGSVNNPLNVIVDRTEATAATVVVVVAEALAAAAPNVDVTVR